MDTLVYYVRDLARTPLPADIGPVPARAMRVGEEDAVARVARASFRGYRIGHYHADPRLDPDACDAVYSSWAQSLCFSRGDASEVLVAEKEGEILAFAGVCVNNATHGEGVLNGTAPAAQGQGMYTAVLIKGMEWCKQQGTRRFVISTQLSNWRVQRVWTRVGMEIQTACYTFHKWFG